jgi:hypothetical protein
MAARISEPPTIYLHSLKIIRNAWQSSNDVDRAHTLESHPCRHRGRCVVHSNRTSVVGRHILFYALDTVRRRLVSVAAAGRRWDLRRAVPIPKLREPLRCATGPALAISCASGAWNLGTTTQLARDDPLPPQRTALGNSCVLLWVLQIFGRQAEVVGVECSVTCCKTGRKNAIHWRTDNRGCPRYMQNPGASLVHDARLHNTAQSAFSLLDCLGMTRGCCLKVSNHYSGEVGGPLPSNKELQFLN